MLNNATLTALEASKICADYVNVIELAVLDVIEYQPRALYQFADDIVGDATIAVLKSLRSFKRRFLSIANVTAWIRRAARWTALNVVTRFARTGRVIRSYGKINVAVPVDSRAQDRARLEAALAVLTDESRTVLVAILGGERAGDVAKRLKLSQPTVSRRKHEAMKAITVAMAA